MLPKNQYGNMYFFTLKTLYIIIVHAIVNQEMCQQNVNVISNVSMLTVFTFITHFIALYTVTVVYAMF